MKWFHHECLARYDSKLQILGATHGAEGIGIYWGLLEEIGRHSDTFHLKIILNREEIDKNISKIQNSSKKISEPDLQSSKIPELPIKILARNLFSTPKKVLSVIITCTEINLFDLYKWSNFNVLYSQSFEQRADDYTRRIQRDKNKNRTHSEPPPDNVRRGSEQSPDTLRSESAKVLLETEAEQEQDTETELDISMHATEISKSKNNSSDYDLLKIEPYLVELDENGFQEYSRTFHSNIVKWNDGHRQKFEWIPSESELRKLFLGGSYERKVSMCYDAYKILHEKVHYPELVLRALQLMLKASGKTRIVNPLGWMWSCLHGNGEATTPWVQLLTAEEESNISSLLQKRISTNHPP